MWPQALQMTRDECRGVLRRLELESYSHVISVFRAQGSLSDNKVKLLEELRGIFHISQERHRAEARRVANDEQLSTIADAICGPNSWQEWSREGRRSFPMLPRVAPQNALTLIANSVAEKTAAENSKLLYPSETAVDAKEDNAYCAALHDTTVAWDADRGCYVVTSDPFKMPDIPAATAAKKNLKRNKQDGQMGLSKKRITSDGSTPTKQHQQKQYPHITASTNALPNAANSSNIKKLYHNHSRLQQQRFFHHQQQMQKQKMASKKSAAATAAGGTKTAAKRQNTSAKSGRKTQKQQQKLLQQQLQQQQQQQQQVEQMQSQPHLPPPHQSRNVTYLGNSVLVNNSDASQLDLAHDQFQSQSFALGMPQIASSKKDITKNLTKLQINTSNVNANAFAASGATRISALDQHVAVTSPTTVTNPIAVSGKTEKQFISTPVQKYIVEDRQPPVAAATGQLQVSSAPHVLTLPQLSSTPQMMTLPQLSAAASKLRAVNTTILPPGTKLTAKKLPNATVVTATSAGMQATTLLDHTAGASGAATVAGGGQSIRSQPQVFNIIEGTTNAATAPTHSSPAVIQLHSSGSGSHSSGNADAVTVQQQQPTQSKVLTTTLLPMVLTGGASASGSANAAASTGPNASANVNKIETLNNGATIIAAGSNVNAATGVSTIIKSLPSTMLLSGQSGSVTGSNSSAGNTIISTLGTASSVFRKPPIIKTSIIGMGPGAVLGGSTTKISSNFNANSSNPDGPQIISNIKLTSAIVSTPSSNILSTTGSSQQPQQQFLQHQQFLQQQLKSVPATGMRTSVKICQSPNGKVFIQPANIDVTKTKLPGGLQHKLLSNALLGGAGSSSGVIGSNTSSTARVAIQKVQIIPAPMSSPGSLPGGIHSQKGTALTLTGSKNNMIFMPSTTARSAAGTITKGSNISGNVCNLVATKAQSQLSQQQSSQDMGKPSNVVVVSATTLPQTSQPLTYKGTTFIDGSNKTTISTLAASTAPSCSSSSLSSSLGISSAGSAGNNDALVTSQMITEDTPVDILNMPIIVDNNGAVSAASGSNIGDTVTVVAAGNFIETTANNVAQQVNAQQPAVILGATDWEMELDQATAVAAASKARSQRRRNNSSGSGRQRRSYCELQPVHKAQSNAAPIVIDDCFEDVIVEEQDEYEQEQQRYDESQGEDEHETDDIITVSNDNIIVLDEENPIDVGEQITKGMQHNKMITEPEYVPIEIIDDCEGQQQQQRQRHHKVKKPTKMVHPTQKTTTTMLPMSHECDADAGFDETIDTEIDENTAIEYIEEDNSSATDNDPDDSHKLSTVAQIREMNAHQNERKSTGYVAIGALQHTTISGGGNITYMSKEELVFTTLGDEKSADLNFLQSNANAATPCATKGAAQ